MVNKKSNCWHFQRIHTAPRQEPALNSARSRLKAMFGMASQALHEPQRSENQAVSELTVRSSLLYPRG